MRGDSGHQGDFSAQELYIGDDNLQEILPTKLDFSNVALGESISHDPNNGSFLMNQD